jgi:hypothetical protein
LREIEAMPNITTMLEHAECYTLAELKNAWRLILRRQEASDDRQTVWLPRLKSAGPILLQRDITRLSNEHRAGIFRNRLIANTRWLPKRHKLIITWKLDARKQETLTLDKGRLCFARLPKAAVIGCITHKTNDSIYETLVLNTDNNLIQWLERVKRACDAGLHGLSGTQLKIVTDLLDTPIRYHGHELDKLLKYLDQWRELNLPDELTPPIINQREAKIFVTRPSLSSKDRVP